MKINKEDIPVINEGDGNIMRVLNGFGQFAVNYHEFKKGTDFTPLLKGLPGDMCPCPHYGYIFEGAFRFIFADGTEEVYKSGDIYYAPAPHTAIVDEDTRLLDFSPQHEHDELMEHVSKVMQQ
jgi:hypothetical protein